MLTLLSLAAAVTMDQPIHFDKCSHHAPQSEIRIGATALGAYGLEWKTTTYYGTCVAYEVLDLSTDRFLRVEAFGQDCPRGPAMMPAPKILDLDSPDYESQLETWMTTLDLVASGYACHPPHPELKPVLAYLQQLKDARFN